MVLINSFGNCESDSLGSAIDQCTINSYGDLIGIGLLKPNTIINNEDLGKETYWRSLILAGSFFPYGSIFNFEQTTPDNETATSSTGAIRAIRDGKPQFTFTYDGTPCLVKSLQNKKGRVWDIVFFFEKGILGKANLDGSFSGFQASYFDIGTLRFQAGTDIQSVSAMIQIDSSSDFNTKFGFISIEALGFDMGKTQGAYESNLQVTAVAGSVLKVKAVSACNASINYLDLDETTNWKVNGEEPNGAGVNPATGEYSLEVLPMTAGENGIVVLSGVDTAGNMYRGSATYIVSA